MIIEDYNKTGGFESKQRTGRPKKLSRRDISSIIKKVNKNLRISAPKLADHVARVSNNSVHPSTIKMALNDNGLFSTTSHKKPLISGKNHHLHLSLHVRLLTKGRISGPRFYLQMSQSSLYSGVMVVQ